MRKKGFRVASFSLQFMHFAGGKKKVQESSDDVHRHAARRCARMIKVTAAISIRRSEVGALDFNETAGRISLPVHLRLNSAAEESIWKLAA